MGQNKKQNKTEKQTQILFLILFRRNLEVNLKSFAFFNSFTVKFNCKPSALPPLYSKSIFSRAMAATLSLV